jgi:glyoxylate reductase
MTASTDHRPRIFVTRTLPGGDGPGSPLSRLREAADVDMWTEDHPVPADILRARTAVCDGLLPMLTERIDGALLDGCPTVRAVANMAVGFDNVDLAACSARGVLVTNTPGVLTDATADIAFALLLATARRLTEGERAVREGGWGPWDPNWLLGHPVAHTTLGIVGPGRIGAATARRGAGFDMRILYAGRRDAPECPGERVDLDTLLAESDYVSMHVPLTPETALMCNAAFFAKMRREAIFVNTTRGGVVDQPALIEALRSGTIAGAGLDVATPEPLPPTDPLLAAPNLVIAPHLGSATLETRTKMAHLAVDGLLAALAAERPAHLLNPDAFEAAVLRAQHEVVR